MRIAFITTEFVTEPNFAGGLSNYVFRMGRLLHERGHEVHVFTQSFRYGDFIHEGLHVYRVHSGRTRRLSQRVLRGRMVLSSLWLDFGYEVFRRLRDLHRRHPIDLIQTSNIHGSGLITSHRLPVPLVTRISSMAAEYNRHRGEYRGLDVRILEVLEARHVRRARHLFAPSHAFRRILQEAYGRGDVRVIPTPFYLETADLDDRLYRERLAGKRYVVFFSGLLKRHKGAHVLIEALAPVLDHFSEVHAVLIGRDSPFEDGTMREFAGKVLHRHADRVHLLDPLSHRELYPVIAGAVVSALPSLIDNLPNAALESLGLGTPVIGTREASFDEIIEHGRNGYLVPVGRVEELTAALFDVLQRPDLDSLRQAARASLGRFDPAAVTDQLLDYYDEVLSTTGVRS
jgi:glycosyltransferase involved in cell wall biosynthesis